MTRTPGPWLDVVGMRDGILLEKGPGGIHRATEADRRLMAESPRLCRALVSLADAVEDGCGEYAAGDKVLNDAVRYARGVLSSVEQDAPRDPMGCGACGHPMKKHERFRYEGAPGIPGGVYDSCQVCACHFLAPSAEQPMVHGVTCGCANTKGQQ